MGKLQGRGIFLCDLRRALIILILEKSIPEKRVLYVRGTRLTRIDADLTKRRNCIFTHVGLSAHAHNNYCEVEVHRWLLSELTILCCSLVVNK